MCDSVRRRSCLTFFWFCFGFFTSRFSCVRYKLGVVSACSFYVSATVVWNLCTPHQCIFHLDRLNDPPKNKKKKITFKFVRPFQSHTILRLEWWCHRLLKNYMFGFIYDVFFILFHFVSYFVIILLFIQSPSLPPFNRLDFNVYSFVQFLICYTVFIFVCLFVLFVVHDWRKSLSHLFQYTRTHWSILESTLRDCHRYV